jgi:hypothetical protein
MVRRVKIPKDGGAGERPLGIPTVAVRVWVFPRPNTPPADDRICATPLGHRRLDEWVKSTRCGVGTLP